MPWHSLSLCMALSRPAGTSCYRLSSYPHRYAHVGWKAVQCKKNLARFSGNGGKSSDLGLRRLQLGHIDEPPWASCCISPTADRCAMESTYSSNDSSWRCNELHISLHGAPDHAAISITKYHNLEAFPSLFDNQTMKLCRHSTSYCTSHDWIVHFRKTQFRNYIPILNPVAAYRAAAQQRRMYFHALRNIVLKAVGIPADSTQIPMKLDDNAP